MVAGLQAPWGSNKRVSSGSAAYLRLCSFIFTSVFFGIYVCFLQYLRLYSLISMSVFLDIYVCIPWYLCLYSLVFKPVHPFYKGCLTNTQYCTGSTPLQHPACFSIQICLRECKEILIFVPVIAGYIYMWYLWSFLELCDNTRAFKI